MLWRHWRCILRASLFGVLPITNAAPTDVPSAASFYVRSLPDLHQDDEHPLHLYSGHILSDPDASKASATDVLSHLFFVMVKARRMSDKERVMFWFNGGPGCSSFDGLMMEVGPWKVDGKGGLKTVEGGWEEYTTMIYIDQPAGTGFSYAPTNKFVHGIREASDQWMVFLRNFYKIFPEYQSKDTYLGGESFAGQFIPYFGKAILDSDLDLPLKGLAIGNGWIDGKSQYPAYLDYGVKHGLIEEGSDLYKEAKKKTDACTAELNASGDKGPVSSDSCEALIPLVLSNGDVEKNGQKMCTNIYDVRLDDTSPACGMNWPVDLKDIGVYLARKDVVHALHADAKSTTWQECQGRIHNAFDQEPFDPSITLFPDILAKIPILVFAGDKDFICNYVGIENMVKNLEWNGEKGLGKVQTQSWTVDEVPAGTWVSSRNLTYVKLFNASHMAPYDVPHAAHDMILRFMGVNFSAIVGGSARIPSRLGDEPKPVFIDDGQPSSTTVPSSGKSPQQDKAMWEAYYNAGSAALVLVLIALAIGVFLWCRLRRRPRATGLSLNRDDAEEHIPLNAGNYDRVDRNGTASPGGYELNGDADERFRQRGNGKGKERAMEEPLEPPIFDVGEHSDDEDGYRSEGRR